MAFPLKRRIYEALPGWVKAPVRLVPFGWLAGREYRQVFARAARMSAMTRQDVLAYQERALGEVLQFVTEQVPRYRSLRDAVSRYSPMDALKEFPVLSKDELQENLSDFLPKDFDRIAHYEISTGGTSGNQLRLYVDDASQAIDLAFVHRCWQRVGYTPRHRKATFRGVEFPQLQDGIFWQHNPIYNELQFSPFHMSETNLPYYVDALVDYRPQYLHGYPSAIDILAEYILRHGLESRLPQITAAFLVSEGVTAEQRERIEAAFRTRVFSFYGHSERVIFGGECEANSTYHQFPDYGYLEIIDDDGQPCRQAAERGELVGTGFLCRSMPLIRYRTGDQATLLEPECDCGRKWDRFTDVKGRWQQEILMGQTGARISIAALNMHGPLFANVKRYQYYQETRGECTIRMMVNDRFTEKQGADIRQAFESKTGSELHFQVAIVDDIPLTSRGKLKRLDTCLP